MLLARNCPRPAAADAGFLFLVPIGVDDVAFVVGILAAVLALDVVPAVVVVVAAVAS
jgi:hypothetical protein